MCVCVCVCVCVKTFALTLHPFRFDETTTHINDNNQACSINKIKDIIMI